MFDRFVFKSDTDGVVLKSLNFGAVVLLPTVFGFVRLRKRSKLKDRKYI